MKIVTRRSFACGAALLPACRRACPLHPSAWAQEKTPGEMFGTREYLKNNYIYRMAAALTSHIRSEEQIH